MTRFYHHPAPPLQRREEPLACGHGYVVRLDVERLTLGFDALARAEGQVVFDRLLTRFPVIEPAWTDGTRPVVRPSPVLRGRASLLVHCA